MLSNQGDSGRTATGEVSASVNCVKGKCEYRLGTLGHGALKPPNGLLKLNVIDIAQEVRLERNAG